jgi:hypothetical protein
MIELVERYTMLERFCTLALQANPTVLADAAAGTRLPERPDSDAVDRLLTAVRERNL